MFLITTNSAAIFQCCCCDHKMCLVYCFSGKCLMHWTVPVECWGECYCWLGLGGNILLCVWLCRRKKIFHLYSWQRTKTGLNIKRLQDNIEIDIKEMALMVTRTEYNICTTYSQYRYFHSRYLVQTINILPSRYSSDRPLRTYTLGHRLLMLNYATHTPHRCA